MALEQNIIKAIAELRRYFESNNITFILIGALVPQILIDLKEKDGRGFGIRPTNDVDCSIRVKSWQEYEQILENLRSIGFEKMRGEPEHRLYYGTIPVDLIPYGDEIVKENILVWPKTDFRMQMFGFAEMFRLAHPEKISDDLVISVIPLTLSVYSKILAFLDRKADRDIQDIIYIIEHYEEVTISERRFQVIADEELPYMTSGAFLLGQDLKKCIPLIGVQQINEFLLLFDDEYSLEMQRATQLCGKDFNGISTLLNAFGKGLSI